MVKISLSYKINENELIVCHLSLGSSFEELFCKSIWLLFRTEVSNRSFISYLIKI
jgi:hypothetical protein